MKRSLILLVLIISLISVGAFSASALQTYENGELRFSVPDALVNDAQWAQQQGYTYAFCDSGDNIELDVSVFPNDGFAFAGMDDASLDNYASVLEDNFTQEGYSVNSVEVVACDLSDSVEGVNVTVNFASGEIGDFYWYATETTCYDLEFYVFDSSYSKYIEEVMSSVSIVPAVNQGGSVADDDAPDFEIDDTEDVTDSAVQPSEGANSKKTVSSRGITIEIPDFMVEDEEWALEGEQDFLYTTRDYLFQVSVETIANTDDISFVKVKDSEFKELFATLKEDAKDKFDKYELISYDTVKVNGFEGIKFLIATAEGDIEYERTIYYFSTKDYVYTVTFLDEGNVYTGSIDTIINSMSIDGKALNRDYSSVIYIIVAVAFAGISSLIGFIKKKKAKKNMPLGYPTPDGSNNPVYFNPQTDAYGAQYRPEQNAYPQTPAQPNYQNGNGYIQNTGYAPDYDYSNKLDTTLNRTDDFSKSEYRRVTADMEKKFTDDEVE